MKSATLAVVALVAAASAQNINDLPECGQICATNMLSGDKAEELGCSVSDVECLCLNRNFTYGFRDCSLAVCNAEDAQQILEYGLAVCAGVGVQITTMSSNGQPVPTRTGSGANDASVIMSTIIGTITSDGETITTPVDTTILGVGAGDVASSVAAIVTTVTQDGSAVVQTITSEVGEAASSIASEVGSGASSITSEIGSAVSSAVSGIEDGASSIAGGISSAISSVGDEVSSRLSDISSEINGASSTLESIISSITNPTETDGETTETSTSEDAAVPQKTAAPLGMIAAAGLAALLL